MRGTSSRVRHRCFRRAGRQDPHLDHKHGDIVIYRFTAMGAIDNEKTLGSERRAYPHAKSIPRGKARPSTSGGGRSLFPGSVFRSRWVGHDGLALAAERGRVR